MVELPDCTPAVTKSILNSSSLLVADSLVHVFKSIAQLRCGYVCSMMKIKLAERWASVVEKTVSEIRQQ
jgi:hypothetical protein